MSTLCTIEDFLLDDAGAVPNNMLLPLLIYRRALTAPEPQLAKKFEETFAQHGWKPAWRYRIYDYDHYHSTAHEVIGVYRGRARVRFGHTEGVEAWLEPGDAVVIPAGVSHMALEQTPDFHAVGAYPPGQEPDLLKPDAKERPEADKRIDEVPLPKQDPVFGKEGPLIDLW